ncbi:unnamed protein product [Albugo candida]|uniref:Uncharacterized protein n=1 Tax=Albugo candida TaxID=65357 RepID=A0A024GRU1_9STRA|nr:unnamed protein product [Albugo candida]|eukprot:CCI49486.1 unnamed protein product [Albugo candida]
MSYHEKATTAPRTILRNFQNSVEKSVYPSISFFLRSPYWSKPFTEFIISFYHSMQVPALCFLNLLISTAAAKFLCISDSTASQYASQTPNTSTKVWAHFIDQRSMSHRTHQLKCKRHCRQRCSDWLHQCFLSACTRLQIRELS